MFSSSPTDSTVACGERRLVSTIAPHQLCPADCGQRYIPEKDCVQCQCGVGKSGDVNVGFDEPCPVGYDHRANGAFFRSCGPVDDLREYLPRLSLPTPGLEVIVSGAYPAI